MSYLDVKVGTAGLYGPDATPQEMCDRARDEWLLAFKRSGLVTSAFHPALHVRPGGTEYLIAWFIGSDGFIYNVILRADRGKVIVEGPPDRRIIRVTPHQGASRLNGKEKNDD